MRSLSFLLLLLPVLTKAQSPSIQWQQSYGGPSKDLGYIIQQTRDSGFIAVSHTYSSGGQVTGFHGIPDSSWTDIWVVKLSSTGILQWEKCLGGSLTDLGWCIQQTFDGGYIVAGGTYSIDGDITSSFGGEDAWIIKLDDTGAITWQHTYGGSASDIAMSIQQTSDSGYIVAGSTGSGDGEVTGYHGAGDVWVFKINDTGLFIWGKCYGGSLPDVANSIQQTTDGGYIVGAHTASSDGDVTTNRGGDDYWAIKLDDTGKIIWQQTYGGSADDECWWILQTLDGGYIMNGYTSSDDSEVTGFFGVTDIWTVRLNDTGAIIWAKCYGGSGEDLGYSIYQTSDSNYIIAGGTTSSDGEVTGYHGGEDMWLVKIDQGGNLLWQECLGGANEDQAWDCIQTYDGGYATIGLTRSTDGDATGRDSFGASDVWVVKLSPPTSVPEIAKNNIKIFPNPATSELSISSSDNITSVSISNVLGQTIYSNQYNSATVQINIAELPAGVYFAWINGTGSSQAQVIKKFVKG